MKIYLTENHLSRIGLYLAERMLQDKTIIRLSQMMHWWLFGPHLSPCVLWEKAALLVIQQLPVTLC